MWTQICVKVGWVSNMHELVWPFGYLSGSSLKTLNRHLQASILGPIFFIFYYYFIFWRILKQVFTPFRVINEVYNSSLTQTSSLVHDLFCNYPILSLDWGSTVANPTTIAKLSNHKSEHPHTPNSSAKKDRQQLQMYRAVARFNILG